jgi:membrane protein
MIAKITNFLKKDIWRIRRKQHSKLKSLLIHELRVILIAFRRFSEDKCQLQASALTFFSLLSIVPVVAMAFGVAKGFGFEKMLETQIRDNFQQQQEIVDRVIEFAQQFLENTRGGVIAGIGVALLFWTVIKVLGNIERSFNDIWGIKKDRTMVRKFSDYMAIMMVCPILLILASSMTVFITSQIAMITEKIQVLGFFSPLIFMALKLLPYCVLWALFSFIYIIMPNTRVQFSAGFVGGVLAGTMYQLLQFIYIKFQIGASNFGAIYGSFAALPLFLVWLQMSWLVVLFGAEISFAHQNADTYEFEQDCLQVSHAYKRMLSVLVVKHIVKDFCLNKPPLAAPVISDTLDIPIRLLRQIVFDLVECKILSEVKLNGNKDIAYQPACDPEILTIKYVVNALDKHGSEDIPIHDEEDIKSIREAFTLLDPKMMNIALKRF